MATLTAVAGARPRSFTDRNPRLVYGGGAVLAVLAVWEALVDTHILDPHLVPSPLQIAQAAGYVIRQKDFGLDLRTSGIEFLVGFGLAAVVGIVLGLLAGWYPKVYYTLDPFLSGLYATPKIALMPVIVIWFGIGMASKVVIVFLEAFFAICVNTITGIRVADQAHVRMARSFGGREPFVLRTIALPGSVPFILTGLRLGVAKGLVGIVVGELYAATAGVGFRLTQYGNLFQVARSLVGVMILVFAGMLFTEILTRVERRFDRWRPAFAGQSQE